MLGDECFIEGGALTFLHDKGKRKVAWRLERVLCGPIDGGDTLLCPLSNKTWSRILFVKVVRRRPRIDKCQDPSTMLWKSRSNISMTAHSLSMSDQHNVEIMA